MSSPVPDPVGAPIATGQRYASLDVIRGFAVLGILVMNIQTFSMPSSAYLNPTTYGDLSGANFLVWLVSHLFADYKFLSLFSMLFGASLVLICERAEAAGKPAWRIHYKRNFWLLVIGAVHAYLFWYGDILFTYAICGMFVYLFRRRSPRTLIIVGILLFSVGSGLYLLSGLGIPHMPEEAVDDIRQTWNPPESAIQDEVAAYQGGFAEQMQQRVSSALEMHTTVFLLLFFWRVSGLMLVGMALYKSGFLTLKWKFSRYLWTGMLTGLTGFAMVGIGSYRNIASGWSLEYAMFLGFQWNYWGSLLIAIAYSALLQAWLLRGAPVMMRSALAAVGRLALTNYLLQTLIATSLFYGFGLGLFGQVSRVQQLGIVILIWACLIAFSIFWSRRFRYGPFEWLWRSLMFLRPVPLKG
jgi:uncharacterized protein